ncbi:hypothetical protein [Candidatus Enterovibrio escicola]|uniref:hypothetical protein n=1 Tax=Candidatus Enterovibrio escicola TaxID=1927127 RepID=UPI0011BA8900|nr:hypothetical protein [Candidatus Enterovibrio escacola]
MMGKTKQKISNWKQYNQVLVNRGSVTFWMVLLIRTGTWRTRISTEVSIPEIGRISNFIICVS